jgi:hypothetical protein
MEDIELHSWLVDMATDSFDSSDKARKGAERGSDYYDGKQWTVEEAKKLRKRGEPVIAFNLIRNKIDYLQGLERQQRTQPRALPRTPMHEQDSEAVTDSLRYVCDDQAYSDKKSVVWADLLKAGWAGIEITVSLKRSSLSATTSLAPPDYDVVLKRCAWDRMIWDPHSSEDDFSDATYLGLIIWMDRDEAVRRYGEEAASVFDETVSIATTGDTWDDKPKLTWVNSAKRKRIRVVQMYYIDGDGEWSYAEFTKGGLLKTGPSPWMDEDGMREHPYAWRSSYTDRDNTRYGPIRDLIDPQDEVNKRRSKKLHHDSSRQTFGNSRVNKKVKENKQQLQRPDGHVELEGQAEWGKDFGIIPTGDQAQGQMELLQQAMAVFEIMGPNAAMQGKQSGSQSGRAILAQQQGGQTQMGLLTDALRQMDMQVYRKIWNRIRQFWTGERWIRVTDDQRNMKWVGVNPAQQYDQQALEQQRPGTQVAVMQRPIAEVDIDIILDDAPVVGALMDEQFSLLIDLKKMDTKGEIPFKAIIAAAPNLRAKADLLKSISEQEKQPPNPIQVAGAKAEVAEKDSKAKLNLANAEKALSDARAQGQGQAQETINPLEVDKTIADIDNTRAHTTKILTEADKARVDSHVNALSAVQQMTQPPVQPAFAAPGAGDYGQ